MPPKSFPTYRTLKNIGSSGEKLSFSFEKRRIRTNRFFPFNLRTNVLQQIPWELKLASLGLLLESSWAGIGSNLAPIWRNLEPSWCAILAVEVAPDAGQNFPNSPQTRPSGRGSLSRSRPSRPKSLQDPCWEHLGPFWEHFGTMSGAFWDHVGGHFRAWSTSLPSNDFRYRHVPPGEPR